MSKENFNSMTLVLFILNGLAASISILFYVLGAIPNRETNFASWLSGILIMIIYGIGMFVIIGLAAYQEYRKTLTKGPELLIDDIEVTYDDEILRESIPLSGSTSGIKKLTLWNINLYYTLVNIGDVPTRFKFEVTLTLDIKGNNNKPLQMLARQFYDNVFFDKNIKPKEELQDLLLTFEFDDVDKAKQWKTAILNFTGFYKDHDRKQHQIDITKEITRK